MPCAQKVYPDDRGAFYLENKWSRLSFCTSRILGKKEKLQLVENHFSIFVGQTTYHYEIF